MDINAKNTPEKALYHKAISGVGVNLLNVRIGAASL